MTSPSFVLLGLPDEPIEVSVDELSPEVDFSTSKCGGRCKPPPPFSPSDVVNTAKCGICGGGGGEVGATSTDPSSSSMKLICQIYCPLSGSRFHRTLYLFACVNRNCWNRPGSWIALRAQAVCQEAEAVEETNGAKKDDLFELNDEWDDDEDDWGAEEVIKDVVHVDTQRSNGSAAAESSRSSVCPPLYTANTLKMTGESSDEEESMSNESSGRNSVSGDVEDAMAVDENVLLDDDVEESKKMLEEMRKGSAASLSVTSAASSSRSPTSFLCFDPFYVACVEEEAEIRSALDVKVEKLLTEYKKREGDPEDEQFLDQLRDGCRLDSGKKGGAAGGKKSAGGGSAAGGQLEKYEKGMPKHGDLIFQHFVEVLSAFPSQILRYSWSGTPLLMSPLSGASDVQTCHSCGAKRVFEMQLLPTLLHFLKCDRSGGDATGAGDAVLNHPLVDFGTVLVFSCEKSCWNEESPKLMKETIVLQGEPGKEFGALNR